MRAAAPILATALAGAVVALAGVPTADMAAHAFRQWLFETEGFTGWNAQWYGGHHVPGYSVLFPPLAALLGARVAGALAAVLAVAAFRRLVGGHERAELATWLFAFGMVATVVVGRMPFALGVAFGVAALAFRERRALAVTLALACALASPVAGLFLVVCATGELLASRGGPGGEWRIGRDIHAPGDTQRWGVLVAPVLVAGAALTVLFPEGGAERFVATAFWPMFALTLAAAAVLSGPARATALLSALMLAGAFVIDTPVGQNAVRLGALAAPPALALALASGRRKQLALPLMLAFLYLQALPAVRAVREAQNDPATEATFHQPLVDYLETHAEPGDRVEIPMTKNHWEAFHVARHRALARGWERQLDLKINGLFYEDGLTLEKYQAWLKHEGIRWVAVPDAPLDFSAREEVEIAGGLRHATDLPGWRVYEVRGVPAERRIVRAGPSELVLTPGATGLIRRRHSRWLKVTGACRQSGTEWLRVRPCGR